MTSGNQSYRDDDDDDLTHVLTHRITNGVPDLNQHTVHIVVHCFSYHHHFRIDPLHIHFSTEIVDNFEKSDCEVVGLHVPLNHLIVVVE